MGPLAQAAGRACVRQGLAGYEAWRVAVHRRIHRGVRPSETAPLVSAHLQQTGSEEALLATYRPDLFRRYFLFRRPWALVGRAILLALYGSRGILALAADATGLFSSQAFRVRESLVAMGPLFTKGGQAFSTRHDMLSASLCAELGKLQNEVVPFGGSFAASTLCDELGGRREVNARFTRLSSRPVSAASLGQVYRGTLSSGETVAIKIQRPGLLRVLALDAAVLHGYASFWEGVASLLGRKADLKGAIDNILGTIFVECNYVLEGAFAERFKIAYAGGEVKVPRIYWGASRRKVLTLEWVDGAKLTQRDRIVGAGLSVTKLCHMGVRCSLAQLLEGGYFHADPHPGNLFALADGRLAFVDFGRMGYVNAIQRTGLVRAILSFVNRDAKGLAAAFCDLGFLEEPGELPRLVERLEVTFQAREGVPNRGRGEALQMDFMSAAAELTEAMSNTQSFRLPPKYAKLLRSLGSLEGTAMHLDPNFRVMRTAYPYVLSLLLSSRGGQYDEVFREFFLQRTSFGRPEGVGHTADAQLIWEGIAEMLHTEEPGEQASKRSEAARVVQLIELITRILVDVVYKEGGGREATEAGAAEAIASAIHSGENYSVSPHVVSTIAEMVAADPAAWVGLIARISRRRETREVGSWVLAASIQAALDKDWGGEAQATEAHTPHSPSPTS